MRTKLQTTVIVSCEHLSISTLPIVADSQHSPLTSQRLRPSDDLSPAPAPPCPRPRPFSASASTPSPTPSTPTHYSHTPRHCHISALPGVACACSSSCLLVSLLSSSLSVRPLSCCRCLPFQQPLVLTVYHDDGRCRPLPLSPSSCQGVDARHPRRAQALQDRRSARPRQHSRQHRHSVHTVHRPSALHLHRSPAAAPANNGEGDRTSSRKARANQAASSSGKAVKAEGKESAAAANNDASAPAHRTLSHSSGT